MYPDLSNPLSWWQWLLLAAVPVAILALYFLKLKRRPLEVPSTYLWHKSIEDVHVNSIWQRLRRNLLLLLQLLVVLMAILALLRPSWQAMRLSGGHFIFLVDNSASMQSTDIAPSRLDEAKRQLGDLIRRMSSGDAAMIISFSDTARVEQPYTNDRERLLDALAGIKPTARSTSLAEALRLAAGLANPGRSGEAGSVPMAEATPARLFVFSDGKFPPVADFELGNLDPVFVPIQGKEPANVAIVAFSAGRQEDKSERLQAFARLANCGPKNEAISLKLFLEGRSGPINADRLEIPAGQDRGVAFDLGDVESGVLRLEAAADDHLAVDNTAWTVLSPPRRARVLLLTPGNERLKQALTTKAAAERAEVQVATPDFLKTKPYTDQADGGAVDLVIYDRCRPERMPRANTFFIGSLPPKESGWSAKPKVESPQIIDTQVSHPLMAWVDMDELRLLAEATPLVTPRGGSTVVDSDAGPLMALAPREGFEDLVLAFTLLDESAAGGKTQQHYTTDWPIRVGFSSFALNLLSYTARRDRALQAGSLRPGGAITVEAPNSQATLEIHTPSGNVVEMPANRSGKTVFAATEELGMYRVQSGGKGLQPFAVNLADAAESDIRAVENPSIKIGYVEVAGQQGLETGRREIWRELLVIGLVVSLLEWYTYMRRICF